LITDSYRLDSRLVRLTNERIGQVVRMRSEHADQLCELDGVHMTLRLHAIRIPLLDAFCQRRGVVSLETVWHAYDVLNTTFDVNEHDV